MTGSEDTPTLAASAIESCAPSRTTEHCRTKVLAHFTPGARRAPGLTAIAMTAPMTAPGTALPISGTYCPTTVATAATASASANPGRSPAPGGRRGRGREALAGYNGPCWGLLHGRGGRAAPRWRAVAGESCRAVMAIPGSPRRWPAGRRAALWGYKLALYLAATASRREGAAGDERDGARPGRAAGAARGGQARVHRRRRRGARRLAAGAVGPDADPGAGDGRHAARPLAGRVPPHRAGTAHRRLGRGRARRRRPARGGAAVDQVRRVAPAGDRRQPDDRRAPRAALAGRAARHRAGQRRAGTGLHADRRRAHRRQLHPGHRTGQGR